MCVRVGVQVSKCWWGSDVDVGSTGGHGVNNVDSGDSCDGGATVMPLVVELEPVSNTSIGTNMNPWPLVTVVSGCVW